MLHAKRKHRIDARYARCYAMLAGQYRTEGLELLHRGFSLAVLSCLSIPRRSCRFASIPAASMASGKGTTRIRSSSPPTPAALRSRPRGGAPPGGIFSKLTTVVVGG